MHAHWLIGVFIREHMYVKWLQRFIFMPVFEKYFIKATEAFFPVYITSSKHLVGWENSQKLHNYKPLTASWICITC